MAIVIPHACKTHTTTMTSMGIQADISDPEGVLGTIRSFQEQLTELQNMASTLNVLRSERADAINNSAGAIEELGRKLDDLFGNVSKMEDMLDLKREVMAENDKELEDLTNEKERLETEAGEMHGQEVEIHNVDLDNEQRLLGFVQEELLRKTAELSLLQQRFEAANQEYNTEWEEYKKDLLTYEEEKKSYLEDLDHLNEMTLAKHVGMQSTKDLDSSSRDLTERLVSHHFNKIQHRQLQNQLIASQLKQKDIEDEIGTLIDKKKELWKRCLDLERCLEELKDSSEEGNLLHPTSAHSDLPEIVEGKLPKYSVSSEEVGHVEPDSAHGYMLHRCHKNINISIVGSLSEENLVSMTTKVDSGAVDIDSEKIDSGRDTNDAMPPAPEKDRPGESEGEEDGEDDGQQQTEDTTIETQQVQQERAPTRQIVSDADSMLVNMSMFAKMRQRVSGLSSSLRRRTHNPVFASGSTKRADPSSGRGGRRRR